MGDGLSWSIVGPLCMELLVAPLLCFWQGSLAGSCVALR
jgi:hypothetical protein